METAAFTVLLFLTVSAERHLGKHVYISNPSKWGQARTFCKTHFTELSPITSLHEEERLKNAMGGLQTGRFWTGLFWNGTHWRWSGGRSDNIPRQIADWSDDDDPRSACLCLNSCDSNRWEVGYQGSERPFLCINLVIVEMRKSWEEALESCRKNRTSLTSVTSETELFMAKVRIQQDHITERVWIGLRFLRNRWMWVNTDPLVHQVWSEASEDHQCPVERRCGALNKLGQWENWDCQEKLNFICS